MKLAARAVVEAAGALLAFSNVLVASNRIQTDATLLVHRHPTTRRDPRHADCVFVRVRDVHGDLGGAIGIGDSR